MWHDREVEAEIEDYIVILLVEIDADDEDFWYGGAKALEVGIEDENGELVEYTGPLPENWDALVEAAGEAAYEANIGDWYRAAQEP